jgi:hypothetical protein
MRQTALAESQPGRVSRYERAIQAHVARDTSLAPMVMQRVDIATLHDLTALILELAIEFPAACRAAGVFSVAAMIGEADELLALLLDLERIPEWAFAELPRFTDALIKLSELEPVKPLGALEQWRREVRRGDRRQQIGKPSTWIMDELYHAACYEIAALEAQRSGLPTHARKLMAEAMRVMAHCTPPEAVPA